MKKAKRYTVVDDKVILTDEVWGLEKAHIFYLGEKGCDADSEVDRYFDLLDMDKDDQAVIDYINEAVDRHNKIIDSEPKPGLYRMTGASFLGVDYLY